jgi:periplasmic protein TonB
MMTIHIMDFCIQPHLFIKHTPMTNNDILKADLLDIIFENRNKEYGAYALRKGYNVRMLTALGTGLSVILLFVLFNALTKDTSTAGHHVTKERNEVVIRSIQMPQEKPKEPEQPKQAPKAKPAPKVAEIKFTNPKITEDNKVKEPLPPVEDLTGKLTSTQNVAGVPDDGKEKSLTKQNEPASTGNGGPFQPVADFIIQERDPEFPGGAEALKKFLARYLSTPDELEAGERKVVKVKFKVDKDGSVNTFEIVTSGGDEFDGEVLRVVKKMPRWVPAIQNGINVPVSYVLPVTFIGMEE